MSNELELIKNNDKKEWSDEQWVEEFFEFLQGTIPDTIKLGRGHVPRLSKNQAWSVIWYLQEHFSVLPENIEQCYHCGSIYDSWREGDYCEKKHHNMCGGCLHICNCKR